MRSIDARLIALEQNSSTAVHRPAGMGIEEFLALMNASLTAEDWVSENPVEMRKWIDAMTTDELLEMDAAFTAAQEARAIARNDAARKDNASEGGAP